MPTRQEEWKRVWLSRILLGFLWPRPRMGWIPPHTPAAGIRRQAEVVDLVHRVLAARLVEVLVVFLVGPMLAAAAAIRVILVIRRGGSP